jgi:hypothetical protein
MDEELFQILSLFLLLGLLLTLFGVLQSLGAIRKALENDGAPAAQPEPAAATPAAQTPAPAETTTSTGDDSPLTWARPTNAETATSERSGWPSPHEAAEVPAARAESEPTPEPEPEPAPAAEETPARVLYGDAGLTTATPNEAALRTSSGDEADSNPFETTPEPRRQEPEPQRAAAEDPQEQPFERDGRWWFRRGDELLVYEEQTGQWVAAAEPSTSGSVAATTGAGPSSSGAAEGSSAGQVTTQLEPAGSFWKCPSCGAVNGSTATSCRMCFTARP